MNDHYPPGTFELPGERNVEKKYVFEVYGEIEVDACSEEDAEREMKNNIKEILYDAYKNGDVAVQ